MVQTGEVRVNDETRDEGKGDAKVTEEVSMKDEMRDKETEIRNRNLT